ncbi:tryptophan 2,3-dioxygenase [Catenuloplanes nepalensis]|uniref:Tryptophan 2,3-dioxygenase n=1 Tax=Catenuloplanes nepalensis TaxID=587533 RepID=A0ABT9MMC7_9ACTN|nr:tryptophan 2,3-dioxygenase family protein [Catenuloplanes nepalensis]MDP9792557.1 tryptophan 2,3-dioxygenase [Catenuloplanes nepalensis]
MSQTDTALALAMWSSADRPAAIDFPYQQVVTAFLSTGKHRISSGLVEALRTARDRLPHVRGPQRQRNQLARWLDIVLDKPDGRYDYRSYLALGVLPILDPEHPPTTAAAALAHHDRTLALLISDLCRFEVRAARRQTFVLPRLRPDSERIRRRCRLAIIAAKPALARLGLADQGTADDPLVAASHLAHIMGMAMNPDEQLMLRLTMLPADTCHDEYLFLRVLQCFELLFSLVVVDLGEVISSLVMGRARIAAARLDSATGVMQEAKGLWPLLATMQPEAFALFRQSTDGASAIQSRSYKLIESLCSRPADERVHSAAYKSVPEVRARVLAGSITLDETLHHTQHRISSTSALEVERAMKSFAEAALRWRRSHLGIATRMLSADQAGTGSTSGLPYLAANYKCPVFGGS